MSFETLFWEQKNTVQDPILRDFDIAIQLVKRKQYLDASDRFKRIIASRPRTLPDILSLLYKELCHHHYDMNLRLLIAELWFESQHLDIAFDELLDAVDVNPLFGQIFFFLNKFSKYPKYVMMVEDVFTDAFTSGVRESSIVDFLSKAYMDSRRYDNGIQLFTTLSDEDPKNVAYKKDLAVFLSKHREYSKSAAIYESLSRLLPDSAPSFAKQCEQLLKRDASSADIRLCLVEIYITCLSPTKALRHLNDLHTLKLSDSQTLIKRTQSMLKIFPDTSDLLLFLTELHIENTNYLDALTLLQRIMDHSQGPFDTLVRLLKHLLVRSPKQYYAIQLLSDIAFRCGHYEESLRYLEQLIEFYTHSDQFIENRIWDIMSVDPSLELQCRYLLASLFLKRGDDDKCRAECQLLEGSTLDLESRLLHSKVWELKGDSDRAYNILLSSLKPHPYSWDIHHTLMDMQQRLLETHLSRHQSHTFSDGPPPSYFFDVGLVQMAKGDIQPAIDHFQKIVSDRDYQGRVQLLIARGFIDIGRFDLARSQLDRISQHLSDLDPQIAASVLFWQGISALYSGDFDASQRYFEPIQSYDIAYPFASTLLTVLNRLSKHSSQSYFLSAVPTHHRQIIPIISPFPDASSRRSHIPAFVLPHIQQGIDHVFKGRLSLADDAFATAHQLDPTLPEPIHNRIIVALLTEKFDQATHLLDDAEARNQLPLYCHISRSFLYLKQGRFESALEALSPVTSDHPIVHCLRGDLYFHKQQLDTAFHYWIDAYKTGCLFPFMVRRWQYLHPLPIHENDWIRHIDISCIPFDLSPPTSQVSTPVRPSTPKDYEPQLLFDHL